MKLGILATAALVGVASLAPAAFAQNDFMQERSRAPQTAVDGDTANRVAVQSVAPTLESVRPPSGMWPTASGPVRGTSGAASNQAVPGGDIRPGLGRE